jgi:hypothetical protein
MDKNYDAQINELKRERMMIGRSNGESTLQKAEEPWSQALTAVNALAPTMDRRDLIRALGIIARCLERVT